MAGQLGPSLQSSTTSAQQNHCCACASIRPERAFGAAQSIVCPCNTSQSLLLVACVVAIMPIVVYVTTSVKTNKTNDRVSRTRSPVRRPVAVVAEAEAAACRLVALRHDVCQHLARLQRLADWHGRLRRPRRLWRRRRLRDGREDGGEDGAQMPTRACV